MAKTLQRGRRLNSELTLPGVRRKRPLAPLVQGRPRRELTFLDCRFAECLPSPVEHKYKFKMELRIRIIILDWGTPLSVGKAAKPARSYPAHRERQRRRILDAAWNVFKERGIDRVTMAEITSASGVQPSTMYQYFSNKDDIVWTILDESMRDVSDRARRIQEGAPNALACIRALLDFMADELANNPAKVRFMAQFDAMYAHDWPAERLMALESRINPAGFRVFADLVREGIADGSLRPDLDPDLTVHSVLNALIGAQRRLASLGNKVEQEYGKSVDRLFRETVRVVLLGLAAPAISPSSNLHKTKKTGKGRIRKRSL